MIQNQSQKQSSVEIDVSQTQSQVENIQVNEKKSKTLKITLISVSVLLVIGAVFLTLFLTGVFSTTQEAQQTCPGRNQEYSNDCACKQGYYQKNENNKESDCVGPFKEDIFSKEAIRLSLQGQEDNAAVRIATENLYQIYKYQVENFQTNKLNDYTTTAETKQMHIEHDVHVVTTEVTETYFKVIAFVNKSSFQSTEDEVPQIITGYPESLESDQNPDEEEENMTPQEIQEFLEAWQQQEATDMGIEFEDYIASNLPIAQVVINKDGSIQSLEVPVNMRSDFSEILINFFNHYSPILNNFNEKSSEQIDMGSGSRRVLSESHDDDIVVIQQNTSESNISDGTTANYDTTSQQESQIQNGLVTNSNQNANMSLYNSEQSENNLYDFVDVQQIVTCYVVSYEVVDDAQVIQIEEHFDNIYTIQLTTQEYETRRQAWEEYEQLKITGEIFEGEEIIVTQEPDNSDSQDSSSENRRNLSKSLFDQLNFTLFEKYIFGAKIKGYNTFECDEGNEVNDCRLQPYLYIAGLKIYVSGADFQFDSSNGGIQKTIQLLERTLFDKSFSKQMYYVTPIGIPFYVSFSLDMSSSVSISVTFSTDMSVSLDANLNANATLSAEGGVTAVVARVGAYCDADLFDGNVDLQLYLGFNPHFNGLVRGDISVSALNIRAGIFAQYAQLVWVRRCVGRHWWKICINVPHITYSPRYDLIHPLVINGVSSNWNLFYKHFS